jgi:hypothetical protein
VALDPRARREIAAHLGLASLPDEIAAGIAHALGSHQPELWHGGTPGRSADALRRLAEFLNRTGNEMRVLTEPSDIDDETAELLINEADALAAKMQGFRERLVARAAALDAMPPIRPEHEALVQTVGCLRLIFQAVAAPHVRGNEANLRGFVLACLDAVGIDTGTLKEHPDRLRAMLRVKVALPTPDWPRTPSVLA